MLPITKKLIQYNFTRGNSIKYLVLHDTGNTAKGADALAHFNYFNSGDRGASAHYFVDDTRILQLVEDFNAAWHCGDGKGKYGITNKNSIGIEMCINADCNFQKTMQNTLDLVVFLMKKYAISLENVVRHYDASRKLCPAKLSESSWAAWFGLKKNIQLRFTQAIVAKKQVGTITSSTLNIRQGAGTNYDVMGLLKKGETVELEKRIGDWWSIRIGTRAGYIHSAYVKTS